MKLTLEPIPFTADFNLEKYYEVVKAEDATDPNQYVAEGNHVVEGYASTGSLDAQRHIITEDAIKQGATSLNEYRTILFNHDPNRPIGKLVDAQPRDNRLWIKVVISKSEPLIWEKIKDGTLSKFSVKGKILQADKELGKSDDGSPDASKEILIIKSMELYEVSLVSVPANSQAKSLMWYIEKALADIKPPDNELKEETADPVLTQTEEDVDLQTLKDAYPWLIDVLKALDEDEELVKGITIASENGKFCLYDGTKRIGEYATMAQAKIAKMKLMKAIEEEDPEIQTDPELIDIENLPVVEGDYITLEKFIEGIIPIDTPLEDFELVKELACQIVEDFTDANELPLVKAKDKSVGQWITYNGNHILVGAGKAAKKVGQHIVVGTAGRLAGATGVLGGLTGLGGALLGRAEQKHQAKEQLKRLGAKSNEEASKFVARAGLKGAIRGAVLGAPIRGGRYLRRKARAATSKLVGLKKSETGLIEIATIDLPWLTGLCKAIDPDNTLVAEIYELEEGTNYTTLEKWVEERLPIDIPLNEFEETKEIVLSLVEDELEDVIFEKGVLGKVGKTAGTFITYAGRHIFIPIKSVVKSATMKHRVGQRLAAINPTLNTPKARIAARMASIKRTPPSLKRGYVTSLKERPSVSSEVIDRGKKFLAKDNDEADLDNDLDLQDNTISDEDLDEYMNEIDKALKGGELFVDMNKNMVNIDKVLGNLTEAVQSGEFKGEDLDQLNAVANAVKALRIRVYGTETTKSEDATEQVVEKSLVEVEKIKVVEPEVKVVEKTVSVEAGLESVIKQLQDVTKTVTEQAALSKSAVDEVNKVKDEITKAVSDITAVVSKIPLRKGQNPEAEGTDRIEKSMTDNIKEKVGEDAFKRMHPGAKLRMMVEQKFGQK